MPSVSSHRARSARCRHVVVPLLLAALAWPLPAAATRLSSSVRERAAVGAEDGRLAGCPRRSRGRDWQPKEWKTKGWTNVGWKDKGWKVTDPKPKDWDRNDWKAHEWKANEWKPKEWKTR